MKIVDKTHKKDTSLNYAQEEEIKIFRTIV